MNYLEILTYFYENFYEILFVFLLLHILRLFFQKFKTSFSYQVPGAKLLAHEVLLSRKDPFPLVGRIDLLYKDKDHQLIPLEIKKRAFVHVYEADKVQLSSYAHLLASQLKRWQAKGVRSYAYILFISQGKKVLKKVDLYPEVHLRSLWHDFHQSLRKSQPPEVKKTSFCRICAYQRKCYEKLS